MTLSSKTSPISPLNAFEPFDKAGIRQGIHQRFEKIAAQYPKRIAVQDVERSLTYETLNNAANNLAAAVTRKIGAGSGQVALMVDNDSRAITALLGVLKSARAYVPLDPLFPKDRLAYMFSNSEARAVITDHAHRDLAREVSGAAPLLMWEEIDFKQPAENRETTIDPMSMAYILYTSGSTGRPKGIAFAHRNLLHTTMCLINNLHISCEDRLTQLHSTSFAASVVDIYCSLLAGASVYPWEVKTLGTGGLAKWLTEQRVTSVQWIPTPLRQMLETLEEDNNSYFTDVRLLVMASEPLTRREFDLYRSHFPRQCLLVNQMGTSESYNYYLFFADKDTQFDGSIVPAGYPVSEDRQVLLLDENRKPVAPGEVGEIAIRSQYMSLGYWQNPEQSAKVFLPDADGVTATYVTGDIGRFRPDGCLLHLGRKDFQVKIRGYRIELPEVELAVKKLPAIRDVVVMARHDEKGELKLVAYYLTDQLSDLSVTELRNSLADKLPDYMIPNTFVRLREFPMTPSGKLDKNALPAPGNQRPVLSNDLVASRTESERIITEIWKEILGRKEIGVIDNFFELGGDSLQAALILHQIHLQTGTDLGYSALARSPRIADLAALVDSARIEARQQFAAIAGDAPIHNSENPLRGLINRILQVLALYAPGLTTWRVRLHRWRRVHIGNNVAIGTAAIIETAHPELVWIGDNVAIGIRNVIIGHFSDSIDRNRKPGEPTVRICDNVYIGPNVTILPNVTIGEGAVVSAGSVVSKSIPPRTMVRGNPAVPVAICEVPLVGSMVTYEEFLRHLRPITPDAGPISGQV
ncbi:MAG TPA: AMP-binding protein [Verrucomicrobiae bacterium]|jgi:amino acid adenylation domain-containing protein|nr:AMP-binding protein [Verrucomicrobiae bacterium]